MKTVKVCKMRAEEIMASKCISVIPLIIIILDLAAKRNTKVKSFLATLGSQEFVVLNTVGSAWD